MNIKFRMPRFNLNLGLKGMFKELLMTFLATTLSIVLTFGTASWLEKKKQNEARRLLAMTIIFDIDRSIEVIRNLRNDEERGNNITRYLMTNINRLEQITGDTLDLFIDYVSNASFDTKNEFNKSNENIFHSSQDSWSTLDDRTFINNVQTFYHTRTILERIMKEWVYFQKPVDNASLRQFTMDSDEASTREGFVRICRELLTSVPVKRYIDTSYKRFNIYQSYYDMSVDLNEKNKFLMNITDDDMQAFVDATIRDVHKVNESNLIGTWEGIYSDMQSNIYEFHKDKTFTTRHVIYWSHPIFFGKMTILTTMHGKWAFENDSLVNYFDINSFKMEIDDSGITYQPEMADSVQAIKKILLSYENKRTYLNGLDREMRQPRATNLDRTGKRLELTSPEGQTTHYQRREEGNRQ